MPPNKVALPHSSWVAGLLISVMFMCSMLVTALYLFSSSCVCHFHSSRITRISYGTRLSQSSVRRMQTGPGRPSFCSFQPLVFSSRDCFSIGLLPFCPPFACGGCGVLACPHTTAVHVERSSGAVYDLLRDHNLLDTLEAG